jgi:hypothetical protein
MSNFFFASMMSGTPTLDADIEALIIFDFNAKNNSAFTLRNDGGVNYVVDYIDRGITVSQGVASQQPVKLADTCVFDGTKGIFAVDVLTEDAVLSAVAVANFNNSNFGFFNCLVSTRTVGDIFHLGIFGLLNTTNIFNSVPEVTNYVAINNINTASFLPMNEFKSVYVTATSSYKDLAIGQDPAGALNWNGNISRVILFSAILTTDQRNRLQSYLQAYHNFIP